jgi:hypothetical protein
VLNILILSYVIYLSYDLRHKHLLSDEADNKHPYIYECLAQTTDVSHESENVIDFALVSIVHLVAAHVDSNQEVITRCVTEVVVIGLHI